MAKKMYYSAEEAAVLLGIGKDELEQHVRDGKLRIFRDGMKQMFRVDEVDKLAGLDEELLPSEGVGSTSGLADLMAADTPGDQISLSQAEAARPPIKEDTVITAEGISIFDDEDLEIESADPMAKTHIAASVEDQVTLEGVGSGSGLLDLTRESDDTSLGAEVLDHIDMEGEPGPAPAAASAGSVASAAGMAAVAAPEVEYAGPAYAEAGDADGGLFGGIIIGCALVAGLLGAVALSTFSTTPLPYMRGMKGNLFIVVGAGLLVILISTVLGWMLGRATATRQAAMRRMGA